MDGFSVNGANVDTVNGNVVIHGKVATTADRTNAEKTVRSVTGVKTVKTLLQVVPSNEKDSIIAEGHSSRRRESLSRA
jgi:hypothetical protein